MGGFGISAEGDPLLVEDVCLIRQRSTSITVKFDDEAVADYFDRQVDDGFAPERFARLWIHTHPGNSPQPSLTDEETFARVFGECDWAVMFILAQGGQTYARLRFNAGPGGEIVLPTDVDFGCPFPETDWEAWEEEYLACVTDEDAIQREVRRGKQLASRHFEPADVFAPREIEMGTEISDGKELVLETLDGHVYAIRHGDLYEAEIDEWGEPYYVPCRVHDVPNEVWEWYAQKIEPSRRRNDFERPWWRDEADYPWDLAEEFDREHATPGRESEVTDGLFF